mmetsp:Transcript_37602/g.99843  ORF Transcript_37602/g.99843 Transcript_37602/m.99843 type:complete len:208 (+) Transcript_37602:397-1020(+)
MKRRLPRPQEYFLESLACASTNARAGDHSPRSYFLHRLARPARLHAHSARSLQTVRTVSTPLRRTAHSREAKPRTWSGHSSRFSPSRRSPLCRASRPSTAPQRCGGSWTQSRIALRRPCTRRWQHAFCIATWPRSALEPATVWSASRARPGEPWQSSWRRPIAASSSVGRGFSRRRAPTFRSCAATTAASGSRSTPTTSRGGSKSLT